MENICPACYEEMRRQKKRCFWCGSMYSELDWEHRDTYVRDGGPARDMSEGEFLGLLALTQREPKEDPEEARRKVWEEWFEKQKRAGKIVDASDNAGE